MVDDVIYTGNFAKIALNVVGRAGDSGNVLPDLLWSWFGPDAGQPGTLQHVEMLPGEPHWRMWPVLAERPAPAAQPYERPALVSR